MTATEPDDWDRLRQYIKAGREPEALGTLDRLRERLADNGDAPSWAPGHTEASPKPPDAPQPKVQAREVTDPETGEIRFEIVSDGEDSVWIAADPDDCADLGANQ